MRPTSLNAEELCRTEAERACLASLRELSAQSDGPLERHGSRVFLLALELAARGGWTVDRELLLCAALLHDVGLLPGAATSDLYVRDGRRVAENLLYSLGWSSERLASSVRPSSAITRCEPSGVAGPKSSFSAAPT